MTLVDSSVWIEFLRHEGSMASQNAVSRLIAGGAAAYCGAIELELLAGARTPRDSAYVRMALDLCQRLPIEEPIWSEAGRGMLLMSRKGRRVGMGDLLIAALAVKHGVPVLTRDAHFERIRDQVWADLKVERIS